MKHSTGHWTNKNTNMFLNTLLQLFARSSNPLVHTHILSYELALLPSHGGYQPCGRHGCPIFVYPPCSQHCTAVPTGAPGGASTPQGEVLACCPHTTRLLPWGGCAAQPGQGRVPWRHCRQGQTPCDGHRFLSTACPYFHKCLCSLLFKLTASLCYYLFFF